MCHDTAQVGIRDARKRKDDALLAIDDAPTQQNEVVGKASQQVRAQVHVHRPYIRFLFINLVYYRVH